MSRLLSSLTKITGVFLFCLGWFVFAGSRATLNSLDALRHAGNVETWLPNVPHERVCEALFVCDFLQWIAPGIVVLGVIFYYSHRGRLVT